MADIVVTFSGVDNLTGITNGISSALGGVADVISGGLTLAAEAAGAALLAVGAGLAASISAGLQGEQVQSRLAAVLQSTGNAAGLTAAAANDLAAQFAGLAGGSKDAVLAIETIGLRSGAISATQMPAFIKTTLDLGTVMGSTSAAATLLARAQEDPIAALGKLQRAGVLFSDDQKEQIKNMVKAGDQAGATALIMGVLAKATGGDAAAAASTLSGEMEVFGGTLHDAAEAVGTAFLPALHQVFDNYIKPNIPVIEAMATNFASKLGPAIATVAALFGQLASGNVSGFLTGIQAMLPGVSDAFAGLWAKVKPVLDAFITAAVDWVKAQLPVWGAQLLAWGQQFIAWVAPMIPPLLVEMGKLAAQLLAWVVSQIPPLIAQLQAWGVQLWAWVGPMIPPLLVEAGKLASQLWAWIVAQVPPLIAQLLQWGTAFVNWVGPQIPPLLSELGKLLGQLSGWAWGTALPEIIKQVAQWAVAFMDWVMKPGGAKDQLLPALSSFLLAVGKFVVSDLVPGFIGFAKSFVDGLLSGFNTNLPTLISNVQGMGTAIINGIVAGINAAPGAIFAALKSIVDNAIANIIAGLTGGGGSSPTTNAASTGYSGAAAGARVSTVNNASNYNLTVNTMAPVNPQASFAMLRGRV